MLAAVFASPPAPAWSYPIGIPGRPLGDGFFIRHGYLVENTWYNPGYWHTGEDWYALEGTTAGAKVYAVAAGEVVYADADYPGRVVIVKHADDLFSMYGHLDPALAVQPGQQITRSTVIGTVLHRSDGVPDHLHFEIRTFLTTSEVNGAAPRYAFQCGPNCPPGPGYWPMDAPELPTALGWRNPTHVIAHRAFPVNQAGPIGEVVVATHPVAPSITLWKEVAEDGTPRQVLGELPLQPAARFPLLEVQAGLEAPQASSAHAYQLWYRIQLPDTRVAWVQAAVPSTFETGADGRPSSIYFNFYPAVAAP
jgi:murein DD-endopeptidase MepM/ murein hydrolase activator NlpD